MDTIRQILEAAGLLEPGKPHYLPEVRAVANTQAGRAALEAAGIGADQVEQTLVSATQGGFQAEPGTGGGGPAAPLFGLFGGPGQPPGSSYGGSPVNLGVSPTVNEQGIMVSRGNPPSAVSAQSEELDDYTKAQIGLLNAQAANQQAQADKAQADLSQATSEEARNEAKARLATAQAQAARAALELEQTINGLTPEQQIRLTDQLARDREVMRAEAEAKTVAERIAADQRLAEMRAQLDRDLQAGRISADRELQGERIGFEREQLATQTRTADLDRLARREEVIGTQNIAIRGQELERLRAENDFVLRMMAQRVAAGELSLAKAGRQWDAYLQRARLPSEILRSTTQAMEPFIPYLTSMKAGDIPVGFEAGGPVESLYRMAGATYDPKRFAANPVTLDLKKLGADAGANWSQSGKVPDPAKLFNIDVPKVEAKSALGQLGPAPSPVAPLSANMVGSGINVGPMPDDLRKQLEASLGKAA